MGRRREHKRCDSKPAGDWRCGAALRHCAPLPVRRARTFDPPDNLEVHHEDDW